jgi:phage portal protein BeeE
VSVLRSALRRDAPEERMTVDDYVELVNGMTHGGLWYDAGVQQTLTGGGSERIGGDFAGLARSAYAGNGVVFACMLVRQLAFSAPRFRWQKLRGGKPSDMFGTPALGLLERPWPGGTTQDLLNRVIQDADLAGNSYWSTDGDEMVRLRPDWVEIVAQARRMNGGHVGWRRFGYMYTEGGIQSGNEPVPFLATDVAHFAPIPDPLATFRGMSWLTPIVREVQGDKLMSRHKSRFFENGATPNMIVRHAPGASQEKIERFAELMAEKLGGEANAYKTLHMYPGSDATVVGRDFRQVDFKAVQGAGETRIAAAAGVPPVIVGLSEGLQAATYSNYAQARRRFADGTMHPLWQNAAGSLAPLLPSMGDDVRLWYDASDVPFLREDEKDAAVIAETQARTIRTLVDGGYTPDSAIAAIESGDWRLLEHSGLYSVQLQPAGVQAPATPTTTDTGGADDAPDSAGD